MKKSVLNDAEENGRGDLYLQMHGLSSFTIYLSGRLDAADRRASLVIGGAAALLGIIAADLFTMNGTATMLERFQWLVQTPSILSATVSAIMAFRTVWPRKMVSDDWISQIFLSTEKPAEILARVGRSDRVFMREMMAGQQQIAGLIRQKNRYTVYAIPFLMLSVILFGLGM